MKPLARESKVYALHRDALQDSGKIGIGKVMIPPLEHLAGVKATGKSHRYGKKVSDKWF